MAANANLVSQIRQPTPHSISFPNERDHKLTNKQINEKAMSVVICFKHFITLFMNFFDKAYIAKSEMFLTEILFSSNY
jgi:hypothetical protein